MYLKNHGGKCCGVKHMHGFSQRPEWNVPEIPKKDVTHGASAEMHNEYNFFGPGAPLETGLERFERYMTYLKNMKGNGHIVEVILNNNQNVYWEKILEDAGFVLSVTGKNCNTSYILYVYHLVLPLKPKKEKEK